MAQNLNVMVLVSLAQNLSHSDMEFSWSDMSRREVMTLPPGLTAYLIIPSQDGSAFRASASANQPRRNPSVGMLDR